MHSSGTDRILPQPLSPGTDCNLQPRGVPESPSGNTRQAARISRKIVEKERAIEDERQIEALQEEEQRRIEAVHHEQDCASGRRTPKDVLFRSPPRVIFPCARMARDHRVTEQAPCLRLSDVPCLSDNSMPLASSQGFNPSSSCHYFFPIARAASRESLIGLNGSHGGLKRGHDSSCSLDGLQSSCSSTGWSISNGRSTAVDTPPCAADAFETHHSMCQAPEKQPLEAHRQGRKIPRQI